MASPDLASPWLSATGESVGGCFNIQIEEVDSADFLHVPEASTPSVLYNSNIPMPPALPPKTSPKARKRISGYSSVPNDIKDTWDLLFKKGYEADVYVITNGNSHIPAVSGISYIPAHSNVLSIASPVLANIVEHAKVKKGMRYIKILGVPHEAVYAFIRFLYSSCFEEEQVQKFILPLLVLSHTYSVPSLKSVCVHLLENGWLTKDNVIDALQLARNCDAPRLSLFCVRMIVKDLKSISSTEGWKVMRRANPALEQELVEAVVEADSRKQERSRRKEEKKVYLQLHEAMEALLHICREGCRTIGPRDKVLKGSQTACNYSACKGLEALVRHFSNCKTRVPGGCVHCKRMWQLLELHSRMCSEPDFCKVPLCRHFKEKMQQQTKKDEAKWKLLVSKVIAAKNSLGPFSAQRVGLL